jgi:hypothetical protein
MVVVVAAVFAIPVAAQTSALRGVITDESGAVVPGATITVKGPSGTAHSTNTGGEGSYSIGSLAPGSYIVQVSAPGLALTRPVKIVLKPGTQTLNLQLKVAQLSEQVTVQETFGSTVNPEPANNASAVVLQGADLDALADDPTNLAEDLQALAGPAAGPDGGQIFIDGFSGGQLPSKDSIREIRINQNPFAPEYDKLGFGRIEIFTKPGTDKYHGTAFYNFADDFWNSRNPYAAEKAPFLLREYGGSVGGPIGSRSSFFFDIRRDATDNGSIINAVTLDPALNITPFTDVYRNRQRAIRLSPRIDYQINSNNTLSARYAFLQMDIPGVGIGGFNLASRGYDAQTTAQTAQVSETAVLGSRTVNEIRFQYYRSEVNDNPISAAATLQVLGSFNGGGAQLGHAYDRQNNYELQDYVGIARGSHNWRFGVRLRGETDHNISPQNFGGTFLFSGGTGPQLDAQDQPVLDAAGQPVLGQVSSIDQYRRTLLFQQYGYSPQQIRTLGGGASQFSMSAGNPTLSVGQFDVGIFAGDDWRVRPNLTLSVGIRYETQTNIHDWRDFAPRVGVAWAPSTGGKGARGKTVLRAGFGIFYDRFSLANTLTAERFNGVVQRQYVVSNPDFFPLIPPPSVLNALQSAQIIEQVSSRMRAPYIMESSEEIVGGLGLGELAK